MTKKQKLAVVVLICGAFLTVLNQTLLNPALPSIMTELGVSATTAQWLISGFTLVNALVIAVSAFLMDRFSTRKLFLFTFGLFTIGSLLAGWGANFALLLTGRILQAVCAGVMLPMSMTILLLIFPHEKRGSAMGMYSFVIMFAPAIGPVVSGVLTDQVGWHIMFFIMAGLAMCVLVFALFALDNFIKVKQVTLDKISLLLSSVGLFTLLYGFSEFGNKPLIAGVAATIGAVILVLFSIRQTKLAHPFLQIRVLADKQFRMGVIISMLISASLTAVVVTLPLYIQTVRGMSATISGAVMMPGALLGAACGYFAGNLRDRFGSRWLVIIGVALLSVGSLGMAFFNMNTSVAVMIVLYCARSGGLMLANTPINIWSIEKLSNNQLHHGNAVSGALRQIASTLGTAIMVAVMSLFSSLSGSELFGITAAYWASFGVAVLCLVLAVIKVWDKKAVASVEVYELDKAMQTPPYTVSQDDTLTQVIDKFIEYKTTGITVVDEDNRITGYISDVDIIRYLARHDAHFIADSFLSLVPDTQSFGDKVSELLGENIMSVAQKKPVSVDRATPLSEVCRLFTERKLNKLPITQDGILVGTISRGDIMRFLMGNAQGAKK